MASVRKRTWASPNGELKTAWQVSYKDQSGKRRTKQFDRKKDADKWIVEAAWEVSRGIHSPDHNSPMISEVANLWIENRKAENLEPTTIAAYDQHIRLHINPLCGAVKLSQLTTPIVEGYRDTLVRTLSRAMATRVLRTLKAIISEAMRRGLVSQNVALPVRIKKQTRKKSQIAVPSKNRLRCMLETSRDLHCPATHALYCLAIFAGLRASELRGLIWSSINFDRRFVEVAQRASASGQNGPPKSNAAYRSIPLPDMAINALKEWKLACPVSDLNLVFPSIHGKVMSWNYMTDHLVNPVLIDIGEVKQADETGEKKLKPLWSLHDFRHAAASLWIEQRVDARRVQYLMGHSSITVTFDTYGHLFEQTERDIATGTAIERALFADAT